MTIVVKVLLALMAGLAVLRMVYALGSGDRKTKIRSAIDRLMSMLTVTVVIYWLYMLGIYLMRDKGA